MMSFSKKNAGSEPWRGPGQTEPTRRDPISPSVRAHDQTLNGDAAMSMLLEVHRGMTVLEVEVKHLTAATDSIKGKVESLVSWKNGIFGGAAVLAVLWGIFRTFSGFVHIGPVAEPLVPSSVSTEKATHD
jgi:hypothetical protein